MQQQHARSICSCGRTYCCNPPATNINILVVLLVGVDGFFSLTTQPPPPSPVAYFPSFLSILLVTFAFALAFIVSFFFCFLFSSTTPLPLQPIAAAAISTP
jgi:hypothetical protein